MHKQQFAREHPVLGKSVVELQSQFFVSVQLQSQIISISPTAQGVMSVELNSSIQGFYD